MKPSLTPSPAPTIDVSKADGTTEAVGYDSPTFNHANGVYIRNVTGTGSAACAQPISANEIALDLLTTGTLNGNVYTAVGLDKALWVTKSYPKKQSLNARQLTAALPAPNEWVKFDVYSGYFKVTNGGASVSGVNQCFLMYARHDGKPYDALSIANANAQGGYNDPSVGEFGPHGKITSLVIRNVSANSGSGSFELDNKWTGSITLTNFATLEAGAYTAGVDTRITRSDIARAFSR